MKLQHFFILVVSFFFTSTTFAKENPSQSNYVQSCAEIANKIEDKNKRLNTFIVCLNSFEKKKEDADTLDKFIQNIQFDELLKQKGLIPK